MIPSALEISSSSAASTPCRLAISAEIQVRVEIEIEIELDGIAPDGASGISGVVNVSSALWNKGFHRTSHVLWLSTGSIGIPSTVDLDLPSLQLVVHA